MGQRPGGARSVGEYAMRSLILFAALAIGGCGWCEGFEGSGGAGGSSSSGGAGGGGGTCYELAKVQGCDEAAQAAACVATFGPGNADPIMCDGTVQPDGNCKALAGAFACARAVFCCGENGPVEGGN